MQQEEINKLHQDFESELSRLQESGLHDSKSPIDAEIMAIKAQITNSKQISTTREAEPPATEASVSDHTHERIAQLRSIVNDRTDDRLRTLSQAKQELGTILHQLEETEATHSRNLNEMNERVRLLTSKYESLVSKMSNDHKESMKALKRKLSEALTKKDAVKREAETCVLGASKYDLRGINLNEPTTWREFDKDAEKLRVGLNKRRDRVRKWMKIVMEKENCLKQTRSENSRLKSEVCRLRHVLAYGK
jgi:uncharacterized protein YPO0396